MEERIDKIESKVNALLVLVSILIVLSLIILGNNGYSSNYKDSSNNSSDTSSETNANYDVSSFNEINASDIAEFNKKETYVVYIGRASCSFCVQMLPNLKKAQEIYGYTTQYIDISKIVDSATGNILDNNAYTTLTNLDAVDSQKDVMNDFGATPMMLIIKNNKIIGSYLGYCDYDTFAKVLEDNGLKKK